MAKKTVASLQKSGGKAYTKVIKMSKTGKSGAYAFEEKMVHKDFINDFLNK